MANTREIQSRMKSIQDTMKITNAMYMISSTKLRKAKKNLEGKMRRCHRWKRDCEALWAVWKRLCAVCGRIREINEKRDSVKKRKPSVKESFILSQTVFFFWLQKPCSVVNALGWW